MADKLTQQMVEALSQAAAEPAGLPLLRSKAEAGLFPSTARAAAQKCVADQLLHLVRTETKGKSARELYALTEAGWAFLLAAADPKQVLEDFVRVLEKQRGEVNELVETTRRMASNLAGLHEAVSRVLPKVESRRIEAGPSRLNGAFGVVAAPEAPEAPEPPARSLADSILAALEEWASTAHSGQDCPLPELHRRIGGQATLGEYHDCLRALHAAGALALHPWTGPLPEMPEPASALFVGHGIAYYASPKSRVARP